MNFPTFTFIIGNISIDNFMMRPILLKFSVYFSFLSIIISLTSCESTYSLDYKRLEFPSHDKTSYIPLDTLLKRYHETTSYQTNTIRVETDKEIYKPGEKIHLTIKNNSSYVTDYYYTSHRNNTALRIAYNLLDADPSALRPLFEKQLVSKDPAIKGYVISSNPQFVKVYIQPIDEESASVYDYNGFNKPLYPDDVVKFTITLPSRKGFYAFLLPKYNPDEMFPFFNKEIYKYRYSNIIEVK